MIQPKETVAIGWCDNGLVDGKFTEGLMNAVITGGANKMPISSSIRVQGNQIGRQRQVLFDYWADKLKTDWLLWVDSDIVLTADVMQKLWATADKHHRPVVSGVYFISKESESALMKPYPVLFNDISEFQIQYVHPLPDNEVIQCDSAGFGLVLMHRSIVTAMRSAHPGQSMFTETAASSNDDQFIGEDIVFFRKMKQAGVPLHAHTGARVKHMKRFSLDYDYYAMYWTMDSIQKQVKEDKQQD
jgi:hypothetical protein